MLDAFLCLAAATAEGEVVLNPSMFPLRSNEKGGTPGMSVQHPRRAGHGRASNTGAAEPAGRAVPGAFKSRSVLTEPMQPQPTTRPLPGSGPVTGIQSGNGTSRSEMARHIWMCCLQVFLRCSYLAVLPVAFCLALTMVAANQEARLQR